MKSGCIRHTGLYWDYRVRGSKRKAMHHLMWSPHGEADVNKMEIVELQPNATLVCCEEKKSEDWMSQDEKTGWGDVVNMVYLLFSKNWRWGCTCQFDICQQQHASFFLATPSAAPGLTLSQFKLLNTKYVWYKSGWPQWVCEQLRRFNIGSVNRSPYLIIWAKHQSQTWEELTKIWFKCE